MRSIDELEDCASSYRLEPLSEDDPTYSLHIGVELEAGALSKLDLHIYEHALAEELRSMLHNLSSLLVDHRDKFLKFSRAFS